MWFLRNNGGLQRQRPIFIHGDALAPDTDRTQRLRSLVLPLIVSLLSLAVGWLVLSYINYRADSDFRLNLLTRTVASTVAVNPYEVIALTESNDVDGLALERVRRRLARIRAAQPDCRFVYLLGVRDTAIIFLADSEPEDSDAHSPPGQILYEASPELMAMFITGTPQVEGPVTHRQGIWVSGLAPIRHPGDNQVVAVLGIDVEASTRYGAFALKHWGSLFAVVFCSVLAINTAQHRASERRLRYLATHDLLTGTPNRYALEDALRPAVAQAKLGQPSALLIIDIDNFKLVNDAFGHTVGDTVLVTLMHVFRQNTRSEDFLARIGGDEFAVLLHNTPIDEARAVGERLCEAVADFNFAASGKPIDMSLSIGLVPITGDSGPQRLLACGDVALHSAKDEGRNRVVYLRPEDTETDSVQDAGRIVRQLKAALKADGFVLVFQPVIQLDTHTVTFYEVLIRMPDEQGQLLSPASFLPVAERFGLMSQIDFWVVRNTLRLLKEHPDPDLFVNLSASSLASDTLLERIETEIISSGVNPHRLGLEITETAAMKNYAQTERWVSRLKKLGCRFSLDDFGTGFSSFPRLGALPVDFVKIDGTFVRDLDVQTSHHAFVRAMNTMIHAIGKKTVGEFVENENVLNILRELKVDMGQGYHLGRPGPMPDLP